MLESIRTFGDPLNSSTELLRGGGAGGEFVTVQIQNFSFFGKFVTRGEGGVEKVVFFA